MVVICLYRYVRVKTRSRRATTMPLPGTIDTQEAREQTLSLPAAGGWVRIVDERRTASPSRRLLCTSLFLSVGVTVAASRGEVGWVGGLSCFFFVFLGPWAG